METEAAVSENVGHRVAMRLHDRPQLRCWASRRNAGPVASSSRLQKNALYYCPAMLEKAVFYLWRLHRVAIRKRL